MDPLSHGLVGAVAAGVAVRSASNKLVGLGALAALLPDLDVLLTRRDDPLYQLEFHRQFSHALICAPVFALGLTLLARCLRPGWYPSSRSAFLVALVGFWSASLLDACTSYGTQLWWPFAATRVAWNLVPVVDPLFTLALAAMVVAAARSGRASRWAWPAALVTAFLVFGAVQKQRVQDVARGLIASRGHSPTEIVVKPTLGNQLLWRVCYIEGDSVRADAVRAGIFSAPRVYLGESAPLVVVDRDFAASADPRALEDLHRFSRLSDGYLVRCPGRPEVVGDARYAMLPTSLSPLWALSLEADPPTFVTFRDSGGAVRSAFWAMVKGEPQ